MGSRFVWFVESVRAIEFLLVMLKFLLLFWTQHGKLLSIQTFSSSFNIFRVFDRLEGKIVVIFKLRQSLLLSDLQSQLFHSQQ